jgi:hypothetical protein
LLRDAGVSRMGWEGFFEWPKPSILLPVMLADDEGREDLLLPRSEATGDGGTDEGMESKGFESERFLRGLSEADSG